MRDIIMLLAFAVLVAAIVWPRQRYTGEFNIGDGRGDTPQVFLVRDAADKLEPR